MLKMLLEENAKNVDIYSCSLTENLHQHLITQNIIKYKIVYLQSKKHHFEESGWEEEFNSLFPYKQTESDNTLVKKTKTKHS